MTNSISGYVPALLQRLGQAVKESPRLTLLVKISALFSVAMLSMILVRHFKGSPKPNPPPSKPSNDNSSTEPSEPSNGNSSAQPAPRASQIETIAQRSQLLPLLESSDGESSGNTVSPAPSIFSLNFLKPEAPTAFYMASNSLVYRYDQTNELEENYWKDLRHMDETPFEFSPKDMIVECRTVEHKHSRSMEKSIFPSTGFSLPASFLKEHADGKPFSLKYKDQILEFQLDQQKHPYAEGRKLETLLESAERILEKLNPLPAHLVPSATNSYPFYTLQDGGFIYKAGENGRIELNPETTELRKLKKPNCGVQWSTTSREVRHVESGRGNHPLDTPAINSTGHLLIATRTFTGGTIRNVDVVLTPTHLMLYGNYENRKAGNKITIGNEILVDIQWQHYFQDLSYEEMQEKMLNSSVFCKDGLLQLNVGFRYPTDSELDAMDYIPEWKLKGMMAANSVEFQDHPSIENTPDSIESAPDDEIQEWEPEGKAVDLVELVDQILGPMQETTQLPSPLPESETATPNEHFPIRVSQEMDDRN